MRRWILIVTTALILLAAGLGVAARLNSEWLQYATMIVVPFACAMVVVFGKQRRARLTNTNSPDSVEAITDATLRAAVFLDALVFAAVAVLVGALSPDTPSWVLPAVILIGMALDYWIRRAIAKRLEPANADS